MDIRSLKRLNKTALAAFLSTLVLPMTANAFSPFVVKDIQVSGLRTTEPSMVFSYLPAKVGATFTQEMATDSLRRLYATGLFNDVQITTKGNIVNIVVDERPTISSILFDGMNAFKNDQILSAFQEVGFSPGRALDPALLDRAKTELRNQYVAKGNYGADVQTVLTPLPNNRVGISFQVNEGKRAHIKDISFVGNKSVSSSKLKDEMHLTTDGFMTWYTGTDKFSRETLDADVERIRDYYLDRGYLDVKVAEPQVSISPNLEDIAINISIDEGKLYTVRRVNVAGDLLGMHEELRSLIVNQLGEKFNITKARATANAISLRLGELGYAFAEVNPVPQPVADSDEVDIIYFVKPGNRVYVRQINIGGNVRTRDQVIRREMRQSEAAWYDAARLSTSRERIDRLGYFNDVQVTQVPVSDDQIDINVDVKEKPTGVINFGMGYGTTDKLSFQAGISQDNIFGSGTDLALSFNTSKYNRSMILTHTDPYWTTSGISRTTSAYYRLDKPYSSAVSQDEDTYQIRATGLGLNFGVPISENDRVFMGFTLEQNKVILPGLGTSLVVPQAYRDYVNAYGAKNNTLLLNFGWSKDTRDSVIAPNSGYMTSLNATVGVGNLKYYMLSAQQQYYLPLSKDYTLAFNLAADWGKTYGSKGNPFPVIKNLYAGGIGSVRGYEGASLGPRDVVSGDYLGGNTRLLANVQLFLPFPGTQNDRSLRWFLFADAGKVGVNGGQKCTGGNAGNGGIVENPCGWRYSAGLGLSWMSPLGPLQISYARPIRSRPGDNKQSFQFQIGTAF